MGLKLLGPQRPFCMRIYLTRALLAALCILITMAITLDTGSADLTAQFLPKTGVHSSALSGQHVSDQEKKKKLGHTPIVEFNPAPAGAYDMDCNVDPQHLSEIKDRYKLDDKFQYMKRYVRFHRTEGLERKSITKLSHNLLTSAFQLVDVNKKYALEKCAEPLDVSVPISGMPSTVNASDFMFGVSTTFSRFMDPRTTPINEWVFWLTDGNGQSNGGRLVLMLLDAGDEELQEVANMLGDVGIDVDVYHSDSSVEMAVRYLNLIPTLFTHPDSAKKKWLVTCDDDTFFPSMHALISRFEKYDHTQDMYIGTLSEDVGAVERHGSQAFGGAGVFLSLSLAQKITHTYGSCAAPSKIRESNTGWGPQGDILLRKCIYENTEARLTMLWDLWQLDFVGDPGGFYEWGIKPLSLHHYRGSGWHSAKPGQFSKIAHTCGEDCSLLRIQTKDDFIISSYSISHYPEGITFDTNQMEGTLTAAPENKDWNLDYMMGPQRASLLKTGRKISWDMQESEVRSDGSVLQTYTRKQKDPRWVDTSGQPMSNIDGVIELVWISA